ncbi:carbohydrate-binding domain-containing protein [Cellulosimicrobium sp. CUA-896]|uniref:carbohydrate-binding domain-containing protein n=1 Tax=Cellulosimicrobium sp. CUA-896 TaxID=1517881 RepID=UPI00095B0F1C|nr:carbohydrate-binding domain-containing protein [Cellulosimicrobium sp. CUA-896]OLT53392.1 hypothetical protein BJF88_11455 [Cellulosimicrobium sp. CUA-896]
MRIRRPLATLTAAAAAAALAGCSLLSGTAATESDGTAATTATTTVASTAVAGLTPDEARADNTDVAVDDADLAWDAASAVAVALDGDTATVTDGSGVTVDGATVTVTAPGTYVLSGTLEGQVVVDSAAEGLVQLVLDGAEVTGTTNAAVDVQDADRVAVVLADGSANTLTDAETYSGQAPTASPTARCSRPPTC